MVTHVWQLSLQFRGCPFYLQYQKYFEAFLQRTSRFSFSSWMLSTPPIYSLDELRINGFTGQFTVATQKLSFLQNFEYLYIIRCLVSKELTAQGGCSKRVFLPRHYHDIYPKIWWPCSKLLELHRGLEWSRFLLPVRYQLRNQQLALQLRTLIGFSQ